MVESGRRVVFLAENRAGGAPWYRLAYEQITEETPYSFKRADELTDPQGLEKTCRPNRGPSEGAPIFLMNHWVTTDPLPRPSDAAKVNAREPLLRRARECERVRGQLPEPDRGELLRPGGSLRSRRRAERREYGGWDIMSGMQQQVRLANIEDVYWRIIELRPGYPGGRLHRYDPDWRERSPLRGPWVELVSQRLRAARTVLDVGAGNRHWEEILAAGGVGAEYRSVDTETRHTHDYDDFFAVDEQFDGLLMLELLEHLPLDVGLRFLDHAVDCLAPGGTLVISTPNPAHPNRVAASDVTHLHGWPAQDLWCLLTIAGLHEIEVHRLLLCTRARRPFVPIQLGLAKLLAVDAADALIVLATKPPAQGAGTLPD